MNLRCFERILQAKRMLPGLGSTILTIAVLASAISACGATLFVATTGTDGASCGTVPANACLTIQYTISNQAVSGDEIRIAAGTYVELLTISKDLTLVGAGTSSTIVKAKRAGTVVTNSATTRIGLLTIEDGHGTAGVIENVAGGVNNSGTLVLEDTVVTENTAVVGFPNQSGTAGGIVNSGTLILLHTLVDGNSASGGCVTAGGIANSIGGKVLTEDSYIVQNASTGSNSAACGGPSSLSAAGGVINNQGLFAVETTTIDGNSITNNGPFYLLRSTVENTSVDDRANLYLINSTLYQAPLSIETMPPFFIGTADISSSTLYNSTTQSISDVPPMPGMPEPATIRNSILAGNAGGDCSGDFLSGGYNIVEHGAGCGVVSPNSDLINVPAGLGFFGGHGGPTRTINLLTGSPALGGGNPLGCDDPFGHLLTVDQRGDPRPAPGAGAGNCDVGSVQQ